MYSSARTMLAVGLAAGIAAAQAPVQHHLFTLRGDDILDAFGRSAVFLGDVDGDGRDDFAVGAPQLFTEQSGYVRVFSGATGRVLYEVTGDSLQDALGDRFGEALAAVPDLDNDGVPELAVGAPKDDDGGADAGRVRLFSGATGAHLLGIDGLEAGDELGRTLAPGGDVDGDGFDDLLAGAPGGDRVLVISGEWLRSTVLSQPPATQQVQLEVLGTGGFGSALAALGDVNQDGFGDLAVGAPDEAGAGAVHVISGQTGGVLHTFAGDAPGDRLGRALDAAGDLDGDGTVELIAGATGSDANGLDSGLARVYSGEWIRSTVLGGTPATAEVLYSFTGDAPQVRFGFAAAGAGDVDGDGTPDLVVGAQSAGSTAELAYARVYSGADGSILNTVPGEAVGDLRGWTVAGGGDANADGFGDLLVGMPRDGGSGQGSALVLSGRRLSLAADRHVVDVIEGGTVTLSLDMGPGFEQHFYIVLGTSSGVDPGQPTPVGNYPLNSDGYTNHTLKGSPEFTGFNGMPDPMGRAIASVQVAPGSKPNLVNFQLHYAFFTLDITNPILPVSFVSDAVPLGFSIDGCVATATGGDCNGNGVLDACDISDGTSRDCNQNGKPDECDIASGLSQDADQDGIPDECVTVVYVDRDATGTGDGSSWSNAYAELRTALIAAPPFSQIWVAEGTYKPTTDVLDRGATFFLRPTVGLYGGFSGVETSLSQRDWDAHPTVLSGDIAGNDGPNFAGWEENSWSIVTSSVSTDATTILDGFTITHGYADGIDGCNVFAVFFTSCRGGGLYSQGAPLIRNCLFLENNGGHHGGAVMALEDATFVDCTFRKNSALQGGAVYSEASSDPSFVNCVFEENSALFGGAMALTGDPGDSPRITGCRFNGNSALDGGGAVYVQGVQSTFTGCTFTSNSALNQGGGVFTTGGGLATLLNCVLWSNSDGGGAGLSAQYSGFGAVPVFSCVQGWLPGGLGAGVHGLDPLFVDLDGPDGIAGNADDDLRLGPGSPCADAGNSPVVPADYGDVDLDGDLTETLPLDLAGNPRIADDPTAANTGIPAAGGTVDMGAYER